MLILPLKTKNLDVANFHGAVLVADLLSGKNNKYNFPDDNLKAFLYKYISICTVVSISAILNQNTTYFHVDFTHDHSLAGCSSVT